MPKYKWVGVEHKRYKLARLLVEKKLGRKLLVVEAVHHRDGNDMNNDLDNLEVMGRGEHSKLHNLKHVPPQDGLAWCGLCKQFLPFSAFYKNESQPKEFRTRCKLCENAYSREYYAGRVIRAQEKTLRQRLE